MTVRAPNPLRLDPTRTTHLRRRLLAELRRRFAALRSAIIRKIATEDAFGLKPPVSPLTVNEVGEWRFLPDDQKARAFAAWLQERINQDILSAGPLGEPWTSAHVRAAYERGLTRGFADVNRIGAATADTSFFSAQTQFLRGALRASTTRLRLLADRARDAVRAVADAVAASVSRVVSLGLSAGTGARDLARAAGAALDRAIDQRLRSLAGAEVVGAHAEGQLDAFAQQGVEQVNGQAEIVTAGDDQVCPRCAELEGVVMPVEEAHGLIPLHPGCRCVWQPVLASTAQRGPRRP